MAQTQTSCPRCRQPVLAEVERVFDMNSDPGAKQKLLSGAVNFIHCQSCGFEGPLSVPVVYHDPSKELLLTFFPPEMGLPANEQERLIGPMITQVVNRLPMEKRKAYILQPKTMFTYQTLIETILAADGITKEMLDAQQLRMNLIDRLLKTSRENRPEVIQQEEKLIDQTFFAMLNQIIAGVLQQGDQQITRALVDLQQDLMDHSPVGKDLKIQAMEAEEAVKSLQDASKEGLTREKLLELVISAPNETRLTALVSLARSGMDYSFFEMLTERISKSAGPEADRLTKVRETILEITRDIDNQMKVEIAEAEKLLETILQSPNVEEAVMKNAEGISDLFLQLLKGEIQKSRQINDFERSAKLQQVAIVLQKLSAPPKEIEFIEELLSQENDEDVSKLLKDKSDQVTPEFLDMLNGIIAQSEQQKQNPELIVRLQQIYRAALKASMQKNLS